LGGLAHSVYHPAEYAILTRQVAHGSLGRALTLHAFAGNVGTVVTPLMMVGLTAIWGWHEAFAVLGVIGLIVAVLVWAGGDGPLPDVRKAAKGSKGAAGFRAGLRDGLALLLSPTMLLCFAFYVVLAASFSGLRAYSASALVEMNGVDLTDANVAVTVLIVGIALGMLVGGFLADKYGPRTVFAAFGLLTSSGLLFLVGGVPLPFASSSLHSASPASSAASSRARAISWCSRRRPMDSTARPSPSSPAAATSDRR
jgi:predicted MFS family arabinose efflux permease